MARYRAGGNELLSRACAVWLPKGRRQNIPFNLAERFAPIDIRAPAELLKTSLIPGPAAPDTAQEEMQCWNGLEPGVFMQLLRTAEIMQTPRSIRTLGMTLFSSEGKAITSARKIPGDLSTALTEEKIVLPEP